VLGRKNREREGGGHEYKITLGLYGTKNLKRKREKEEEGKVGEPNRTKDSRASNFIHEYPS
jgi:hypothetical protein